MDTAKCGSDESDRYDTIGKIDSRILWCQHSNELAQLLQRPLSLLGLSNDSFTEIQGMFDILSTAWVPEYEEEHLRAKQRFLAAHLGYDEIIQLVPQPESIAKFVLDCHQWIGTHPRSFDIALLDYCTHLSPHVESTIGTMFRGNVLKDGGLLFLTVSKIARANRNSSLSTKNLARTPARVTQQIEADARLEGRALTSLEGFPFSYMNGTCEMFSFGWKVSKLPVASESNGDHQVRE